MKVKGSNPILYEVFENVLCIPFILFNPVKIFFINRIYSLGLFISTCLQISPNLIFHYISLIKAMFALNYVTGSLIHYYMINSVVIVSGFKFVTISNAYPILID